MSARFREELEHMKRRVLRIAAQGEGESPQEIARQVGCSHVTARKWLREAGLYVPRGASGRILSNETQHQPGESK